MNHLGRYPKGGLIVLAIILAAWGAGEAWKMAAPHWHVNSGENGR